MIRGVRGINYTNDMMGNKIDTFMSVEAKVESHLSGRDHYIDTSKG